MKTTRIKKIFIANRGEIALRIIKAARKMNIATLVAAVPSEKNQPFVLEADEHVVFESTELSETYINQEVLISIALNHQCDAIHPGYGFLSENAYFARKVSDSGLTWIGPSPATIQLMGNKIKAAIYAEQQGLPVIPSWKGNVEQLKAEKGSFPYPVLIKASAGGGGKGMKLVRSSVFFDDALISAAREAQAYFGDPEVYVEQYITNPRHIEVQVFGDKLGNYVHLFERDCSVQRRHQKIIEEAGDINISEQLRTTIANVSVTLAKALQYVGAGTIEYLVDEYEHFYFLEMNTRIQVEHPVTEEVTGIDLVAEQIRVAQGYALSFRQEDTSLEGHAIECRIYAEEPRNEFMPAPGIVSFHKADGSGLARIDTGYDQTFEVLPDFDPMISKVIATGQNRRQAIRNMKKILANYYLQGIKTNIPYLIAILDSKAFINHDINTGYCEKNHAELIKAIDIKEANDTFPASIMALLKYTIGDRILSSAGTPVAWKGLGNWRILNETKIQIANQKMWFSRIKIKNHALLFQLNSTPYRVAFEIDDNNRVTILFNDKKYTGYVSEVISAGAMVSLNGSTYTIDFPGQLNPKSLKDYQLLRIPAGEENGYVYSPLNGKAVKIQVHSGDRVSRGDVLLIIESMKTENKILAEHDGTIADLEIKEGDLVNGKQLLMRLT